MNEHLSSASLKSLAKGQLLGKYGTAVGAYALHILCVTAASAGAFLFIDTTSAIGVVIYYAATFIISLLSGLFVCGEAYLYLKLACNQPVSIRDLFWGFQNAPDKILRIQVVLALIATACNLPNAFSGVLYSNPDNPYLLLLFVILMLAGSIVNIFLSLTFSQCYYLMLDFPQYSPKDTLKKSHQIMKGNKGRLFYIDLSFLPLFLLGLCTCCITFLWILPYFQAVKANFYLDLMKKR